MSKLPLNILLSTPACLTRIAKCWQSQLLSIFLGITHLFSNQVCKSGIAYPLLVRHKVSQTDTADFHGDGYFLQNVGTSKDLRIALKVFVMLTLNTDVFKLILRILRYFYLTPLLYKSTFFTLLFPEVPTDIVGVIFKMTFSSIRTATTINS